MRRLGGGDRAYWRDPNRPRRFRDERGCSRAKPAQDFLFQTVHDDGRSMALLVLQPGESVPRSLKAPQDRRPAGLEGAPGIAETSPAELRRPAIFGTFRTGGGGRDGRSGVTAVAVGFAGGGAALDPRGRFPGGFARDGRAVSVDRICPIVGTGAVAGQRARKGRYRPASRSGNAHMDARKCSLGACRTGTAHRLLRQVRDT